MPSAKPTFLKASGYVDLPRHEGSGGFDHAASHAQTEHVYVAHTANSAVDVFDPASRKHLFSVPQLPGVAGVLVRIRSPTPELERKHEKKTAEHMDQKTQPETQEQTMQRRVHAAKAKRNPLGRFKRPMDVVEATGIPAIEKLSILKAWETDERALQRAEDEGMTGGEHAHLHRVKEALTRLQSLRRTS